MLAMRKPSTVTAMPSASCSSASSSGKRQPQQVRASSSTRSCAPGLGLRPMFRPVVAAVAAPGPRLGRPCLQLGLSKCGKHSQATVAEGDSRGVANCQRVGTRSLGPR